MSTIIGNQGVSPAQSMTSSTPAIKTSDGDITTLLPGQKLIIQNCDTDKLHIRYGTGASTTVFTFIIPACTAQDDGSVPPYVIDDWIGIVSGKAQADTSPRFTWSVVS